MNGGTELSDDNTSRGVEVDFPLASGSDEFQGPTGDPLPQLPNANLGDGDPTEGVVPGPPGLGSVDDMLPNGTFYGINTTSEKQKLVFWLLSLGCFLLGWMMRNGISDTSSLSASRVRSEWDMEYQRHQRQMQTERGQWDTERRKWAEETETREKVRLVERRFEIERKAEEENREKERRDGEDERERERRNREDNRERERRDREDQREKEKEKREDEREKERKRKEAKREEKEREREKMDSTREQERRNREDRREKERIDMEDKREMERRYREEEREKEKEKREDEREKEREKREAKREREKEKRDSKREKERTEDDKKKEKAKEKRKNAGIKWSKLQPDPQCLRHGMRKWTAHLEHLPAEYDPILMCSETKALIHGRWELPHVCEGNSTGPVGTWYIDFSEAACHTFWTPVRDKGCTSDGSGKRKYEAQLENLRAGDDWMIMCSSTPAEFRGLRFDGPHSCDDSGVWGYRGLWFVEDETCN